MTNEQTFKRISRQVGRRYAVVHVATLLAIAAYDDIVGASTLRDYLNDAPITTEDGPSPVIPHGGWNIYDVHVQDFVS